MEIHKNRKKGAKVYQQLFRTPKRKTLKSRIFYRGRQRTITCYCKTQDGARHFARLHLAKFKRDNGIQGDVNTQYTEFI